MPSKANISDLPSRDDDSALLDALSAAHLDGMLEGFDEVAFDLPPISSWCAPLADFAALG